ncbi:polysaccharide deacetylase family protein [uncultured Desulfobacter sp.]|uniref:polysaccharide deacetylase family protein n=1 Tax=uncultured Desulfobacter sp. TaxID=240139 RepID=UPI002AA6C2F8|nr:polysaccharide deacetylase family protein [uncultured Desulfobacter sp.]
MKYSLFTNDVETTSIWFNTLRYETGVKVLEEGMPALLDIYRRYSVTTTFFFTAYIARLFPQVVRMVLKDGHEVGSHGKSHLPENGFDLMPFEKQKAHLAYSKKLLEDISGQNVISFRAPALRVNQDTARALIETGYRIDSSVASQRFDFFLSFGGMKKLKWMMAPRLPYRVDQNNILKKGNSGLVELPLTAFLFPYVGTTLRIFPQLTSLQRIGFDFEAKMNKKPIVFDIHPNEFIDESHEQRTIEKRSSNYISYLLRDVLRSKLKTNNLGPAAIKLYEKEIRFYHSRGYRFTTIKDYCQKTGLLL